MKFMIAFTVCLLALASCSKDEDSLKKPGDGYWTLKEKQYNITTTERNSNNDYFILSGKESATSPNILQVYFKTLPASTGKFKVVSFAQNSTLSSNEIGIKVLIPPIGIYSSTGIADNTTWLPASDANVTLKDGKIKVEIPKMTTVIHAPTFIDTVFLQGTLIEK